MRCSTLGRARCEIGFGDVAVPAKGCMATEGKGALMAVIGDEDTVTGFLLAGVGNIDLRRKTNYLVVTDKTTTKQIEDAFKEMTAREDIAVVLISQFAADSIRYLVNEYDRPIPAVLEIPSQRQTLRRHEGLGAAEGAAPHGRGGCGGGGRGEVTKHAKENNDRTNVGRHERLATGHAIAK